MIERRIQREGNDSRQCPPTRRKTPQQEKQPSKSEHRHHGIYHHARAVAGDFVNHRNDDRESGRITAVKIAVRRDQPLHPDVLAVALRFESRLSRLREQTSLRPITVRIGYDDGRGKPLPQKNRMKREHKQQHQNWPDQTAGLRLGVFSLGDSGCHVQAGGRFF